MIKVFKKNPQLQTVIRSNEELWDEFARGSDEAFTEIYERYRRRIMLYVRRFLGSRAEADDVFQETWINFHGMRGKTKVQNVEVILVRIARNLSLNVLRRKPMSDYDIEELVAPTDAGRTSEAEDAALAVRMALKKLTPALREIFILREYEGFDYDTIASMTEINSNAARVRYHRAVEEMRVSIRSWLGLGEGENVGEHL